MGKRSYSPEYKTQAVLEVLREEKTLSVIASERGVHPNQLRNWKREFLEKANSIFESPKQAKEAAKREEEFAEEEASMLKTIGQLTLERDFLQQAAIKRNRGLLR